MLLWELAGKSNRSDVEPSSLAEVAGTLYSVILLKYRSSHIVEAARLCFHTWKLVIVSDSYQAFWG